MEISPTVRSQKIGEKDGQCSGGYSCGVYGTVISENSNFRVRSIPIATCERERPVVVGLWMVEHHWQGEDSSHADRRVLVHSRETISHLILLFQSHDENVGADDIVEAVLTTDEHSNRYC